MKLSSSIFELVWRKPGNFENIVYITRYTLISMLIYLYTLICISDMALFILFLG